MNHTHNAARLQERLQEKQYERARQAYEAHAAQQRQMAQRQMAQMQNVSGATTRILGQQPFTIDDNLFHSSSYELHWLVGQTEVPQHTEKISAKQVDLLRVGDEVSTPLPDHLMGDDDTERLLTGVVIRREHLFLKGDWITRVYARVPLPNEPF